MAEYTTITLSKTTKKELQMIGKKGETFDEIVLKLISKSTNIENE